MVSKQFVASTLATATKGLPPAEVARVTAAVAKWTPDFTRKADYSQRVVTTMIHNIASASQRGAW